MNLAGVIAPHLVTIIEVEFREPAKYYLADFPPTPFTENHFAKKTLAERGVHPPPFNGKSA